MKVTIYPLAMGGAEQCGMIGTDKLRACPSGRSRSPSARRAGAGRQPERRREPAAAGGSLFKALGLTEQRFQCFEQRSRMAPFLDRLPGMPPVLVGAVALSPWSACLATVKSAALAAADRIASGAAARPCMRHLKGGPLPERLGLAATFHPRPVSAPGLVDRAGDCHIAAASINVLVYHRELLCWPPERRRWSVVASCRSARSSPA